MIYILDIPPYVATVDCPFFVLHKFLKIMARTVERKWFKEDLSNYPSIIETGWQIRNQISRDNNLPVGSLGDIRLEVITEERDETHLSSKAWCVRVNIRRLAASDSLDTIKIRIQIRWDENLLGGNFLNRVIRAIHYLRFHLKLEILMLGNHIIEQSLKLLLKLGELWAQIVS